MTGGGSGGGGARDKIPPAIPGAAPFAPRRSPRGTTHPQPPNPQCSTPVQPAPRTPRATTTFNPFRHPGERRDPWLRRTRRSRAAIPRSATMGPGVRRDDGGWGGSAIKSHPQSRSRGVRPAAARIRSPRTRSDPVRSSPPPQPSGPATTRTPSVIPASAGMTGRGGATKSLPPPQHPAPSRHPGESRDPEPQAHPPAALSPGSGRNDDRQGVASHPANLHQPLIRASPHPSLTSGRN